MFILIEFLFIIKPDGIHNVNFTPHSNWSKLVLRDLIYMTMTMIEKETNPKTMPTRLLDLNALHMMMLIWCWCYIWQFIPTSTIRTKGVHSRNYWVGTLNYEAGNGNWWRLCNHERMLLIGLKVGRYGWKSLVWFFITYSGVNSWCPYRKCLCLATCLGQKRPSFTLTFD